MALIASLKGFSRSLIGMEWKGMFAICLLFMFLGWFLFAFNTDDGQFLLELACDWFDADCHPFDAILVFGLLATSCLVLMSGIGGIQKMIARLERNNWRRMARFLLIVCRSIMLSGFAILSTYLGAVIPLVTGSFYSLLVVTWSCYFGLLSYGIQEDLSLIDGFTTLNLTIAVKMDGIHKLLGFLVAVIPAGVKCSLPEILRVWKEWAYGPNVVEPNVDLPYGRSYEGNA